MACIPSCPSSPVVQRFEQLWCVPLRKFGFFVAHRGEQSEMWLEGIARLLSGLGHSRDCGVGYQAIRNHVDLQSSKVSASLATSTNEYTSCSPLLPAISCPSPFEGACSSIVDQDVQVVQLADFMREAAGAVEACQI